MAGGAFPQAEGVEGVEITSTWLSYALEPGMYTHMGMYENDGTGAAYLEKECEAYLYTFTGNTGDYIAIMISILATAGGMVFLAVIAGNQL